MLNFASDYLEGCHPAVLDALIRTNLMQAAPYGADEFSESARQKIRESCAKPHADIYFLTGGTQTNQLVISSMLAPYEGVIAADTGHVSGHEAGAIEFSGHKVLTLPGREGKLDAAQVDAFIRSFYADGNHEHMVFPGMVYISHPTEYGTLYTARELEALSRICRGHNIPLYMDGARLGYGLQAKGADVTLPMIAQKCDVFYIGGTKVGALCGEALVFPQGNAPSHFATRIKQHGALNAKGRAIGVQFDALFTDGIYETISAHAIAMAEKLKDVLRRAGLPFYLETPTNQQFVVLENGFMERLKEKVGFAFWEAYDESHTVVRFATSWATTPQAIETLGKILQETK